MNPPPLGLVVVLILVALAFAPVMAFGVSRTDTRFDQGPAGALGAVLVRPASLSDLSPSNPACVQAGQLVVARGTACTYQLRSGFFAKRLTLTLVPPTSTVTATMEQPKDKEIQNLTPGQTVAFNYHSDQATLSLVCPPTAGKPGCQVKLG